VTAADLRLNVHHAAEFLLVEGVELAGAAGGVDAVDAGPAHDRGVGAVAGLVEAVVFVPAHRDAGPDAVQLFRTQTAHDRLLGKGPRPCGHPLLITASGR